MKTFSVPTKNEVNAESQQIFDSLKGQIGMVPNIYAFAGYSSAALNAQLSFGQALSKGSLSGKELEVVALATSEVNQCDYCRAAHTAWQDAGTERRADAASPRRCPGRP